MMSSRRQSTMMPIWKKVCKDFNGTSWVRISDPESPAPKASKLPKQAKPTMQSKPTNPKPDPRSLKPAPAKLREKKAQPVSKQLVDGFVDEGVPTAKPSLEDTKEAILQKVLQESLTDAYPTQRGPLPPVVFRETDTGKFQPLPEVPGKGKEKVGEEQAAQVLLNLQTPKKKKPGLNQYIFRTFSHSISKQEGREDSTSLYAELGLSGSDTESDEEMPLVVRSGLRTEGQAGPDPGMLDEGQAGP
ncbi:hypothetical protein Tco_0135278 [Tanacetum coccineum]